MLKQQQIHLFKHFYLLLFQIESETIEQFINSLHYDKSKKIHHL